MVPWSLLYTIVNVYGNYTVPVRWELKYAYYFIVNERIINTTWKKQWFDSMVETVADTQKFDQFAKELEPSTR